MNTAWHAANPVPRTPRATLRIAWHVAHVEACGCRPVPAALAEAVEAAIKSR